MRFSDAVRYYKKNIGNVSGKAVLVIMDQENKKAFFSVAPLSKAIHDKGGTIHVLGAEEDSPVLQSLLSFWSLSELIGDEKDEKVRAVSEFINAAEKKLCKGSFRKIAKKPDIMLKTEQDHFSGSITLKFQHGWHKDRKKRTLEKTCDIIWNQVYNLKPKDRVGIGFETIPKVHKKPLSDYLDSYDICWGMKEAAMRITKKVSMTAATSAERMLDPMERIGDLKATLLGCELSKNSEEKVFRSFRKLSPVIGTNKIRSNTATFFISGEGYSGKHLFGEKIGYPTPNSKARWQSPGGIIYQLAYAPQTKYDPRPPKARVAFTSTLPLDIFLKTCNIDWFKMKKTNDRLADIFRRCERFIIRSDVSGKFRTNFEVGLVKENGEHRIVKNSDIETRRIINHKFLKKTGIKAGNAGNIPAGEVFVTPQYLKGTVVGDVVISMDDSYKLSKTNPFVIKSDGNKYWVVKAPKRLLKIFEKCTADAKKHLMKTRKVLPKEIYDTKMRNFWNIGEFAINTNPKAELCDYLIVNEKIADMIHIALGSGFEDDRSTEYHYDLVIDAPAQKLDITGIEKDGRIHEIMRKGKLSKHLKKRL